jgi:4-hydroxybenzoate polyprenyltransferase
MILGAEDQENRKTLRRLGAISFILGILSITRLSIELYLVRSLPASPGYFSTIAYDYLLATAAAAGGIALFLQTRAGSPLTLIVGAALCLTSALALVQYGIPQIRGLLELGIHEFPYLWTVYGSRWLITLFHAFYWPIAAGHLYLDLQFRDPTAEETRRLKRRFWIWTAVGLAAGGVMELLLRMRRPS